MRRMRALLCFAGLVLLLGGTAESARAQFRSLDQQSARSRASADLQFTFVEGGDDGRTFLRTDLYAEISNGSAGFYAGLPISRDLDASADESAVGNLELGFVGQVGMEDYQSIRERIDWAETLDLVYHLGVSLPTAEDSDSVAIFSAAQGVSGGASSGYASVQPNAASLNLGLSPRIGRDFLFARMDAALDVLFFGNDVEDDGGYYKLGAGVGAELGPVIATLEYVRQNDLFGFDNLPPIEAVDTVTMGASVELFDVRSHAYFRIPVDGADEVQTFGLGVSYLF